MYYARLRINKRQFIALTDKALVIVTEDKTGNPIRWAEFGSGLTDASWDFLHKRLEELKDMERA